jgi:hypothetical protein
MGRVASLLVLVGTEVEYPNEPAILVAAEAWVELRPKSGRRRDLTSREEEVVLIRPIFFS